MFIALVIEKDQVKNHIFFPFCSSLLYESLVLVATNTMIYAFNSVYPDKNDEFAHWPPFLFNMIATSAFYPFVVVSNCMAVTDSGLAAGQPDYMPRFRHWMQCWRWLQSRVNYTIFVPDGINSVGDYSSPRVGVVVVVCLFVCPHLFLSFMIG